MAAIRRLAYILLIALVCGFGAVGCSPPPAEAPAGATEASAPPAVELGDPAGGDQATE